MLEAIVLPSADRRSFLEDMARPFDSRIVGHPMISEGIDKSLTSVLIIANC